MPSPAFADVRPALAIGVDIALESPESEDVPIRENGGTIRQTMPSASLTAMKPPVTFHCQRSATTAGGTWITFPQPATCCQWLWLQHVRAGQRALDVGCHQGATAFYLASWGCGFSAWTSIHGRSRRLGSGSPMPHHSVVPSSSSLIFCGIVWPPPEVIDVVVLNRFLTCLPAVEDWQDALSRALELLTEGGLIYVGDFLLMPACPHNRRRYRQALANGGRWGNFAVLDDQGRPSFVAHHHSAQELRRIASPYRVLCFRRFSTRSRHGHASRMFELIGVNERRPA
jgi:hypothetical protein